MALKTAVNQLSTDVDGKVDRMEIERIESYLGNYYLLMLVMFINMEFVQIRKYEHRLPQL